MHIKLRKTNLVLAIIGTVLVASLLGLIMFRNDALNRARRYPVYTLNDGWRIEKNGTVLPVKSLLEPDMTHVGDNEVWTVSTTLPLENIPGATLYFRTLQAVVEVELEGVEIYSYGRDLYTAGKMLKRGICMVPLPQGFMGKTVSIRFTATEPLAFNGIAPIVFGSEQDLCQKFLEERRVPLFFGVFLVLYALFQILMLPYLLFRNRSSLTPFCSSLVTLSLGLYIIGFYHIIELFSYHTIASTVVEYLSLYCLPLTISAYFWTLLEGRMKQTYFLFIVLDLVLIASIILLHLSGLVHLTVYLPAYYVITFSESLPYLVYQFLNFRRVQSARSGYLDMLSDRILFIGFVIFMVCSAMDTVTFTFAKYITGGEPNAGIPFFMTGAVLFAMATTTHYYLRGISHVRADATREHLEQRAYTDPLTGLANRIRCEQEMQRLSIDDPFTILSLDLDGLKSVNDSLGHAEGDRLLTTFAEVLNRIFCDMDLVGRMGGDEFFVLMTGPKRAIVKSKLKELERALFDLNLEEHAFRYSVSYGYASNHETHFGRHVRDIYMLADRRMYDMKRKRKKEREAAE